LFTSYPNAVICSNMWFQVSPTSCSKVDWDGWKHNFQRFQESY
jgi:hypothetical protein